MRNLWFASLSAGAILAAGMMLVPQSGVAEEAPVPGPFDVATVAQGMAIVPVPLHMEGKDAAKVGYGSYLINAVGGCNDCHTNPNWAEGGNPYLGEPTQVNTQGYLGGGAAFGPFISRNLTPDSSGMPAALSLSDFKEVLNHGTDFKHIHDEIAPILQVMPWPLHHNLTDRDKEALYEYLSAIPCLEGGPGTVENRCQAPASTQAVVAPDKTSTVQPELQLNGSMSTSADGKPLKYFWTIPSGYPPAGVLQGRTATPTIQFSRTRGTYAFDLTVTDSTGATSTARSTIEYSGR